MEALLRTNPAAIPCAQRVDREDADVWRWYAGAVDDERLACRWHGGFWEIALDGRASASERSFDCAIRLVRAIDAAANASLEAAPDRRSRSLE